jgi:hypothetical protein
MTTVAASEVKNGLLRQTPGAAMSQSLHLPNWISQGILALLACLLFAVGLASCGGSSDSNNSSQTASLTLTPSTISLTAGATGQPASLVLTAHAGAGAATITVSGLPAGVTISPSTLLATPGTALPLVFTAAASAATTTATITFTTTVNGQAVSTQTALSIQAAATVPGFTLSATPASVSLAANGTPATVSVLATAQNGFSAKVQVTIAGLPAGVTAQPSPITLTPGTAATLTLTAPAGTAAGSSTVTLTGTSGSLTHAASVIVTVTTPGGVNVTTYHNDNARDGWNPSETKLTPQNVNFNTFGKLRELPVDGKVDGEPLYVSGLSIAGQVHNALIVVTENASAYAFDADMGTQLWKVTALGANETASDDHGCGQITPQIGITDTPVIDRGNGPNGSVFFVAMSKDASNNYHHRLHALDLTTGAELSGSPSEIQASFPGSGYGSTNGMQVFDSGQYAERVGLLLMNNQLYLAWTSHCDDDPYTGWLMAYSETTLQQSSVLNVTPNGPSTPHYGDGEGSVWMSGAGLAGDTEGNIFFLDANGTFDSTLTAGGFPSSGDFGNSFMKVSTTGNGLAAADYFAAYNLQSESDADQDLGSGGAMLLPDQTDATGVTRHLAVGAGKDTNIYVVNRDNMGKFNASSNNAIYQEIPGALSGGAFSMAALFNNTIYYAGVGDHLKAFPITNALLATTPAAESANTFAYPGATPSVSSNGSQNGIVWAIENQNGAGVLHAYDPTNLPTELYDSNQAASGRDNFSDNKFVTPMIANGKVYVGTQTSVAVFGLLP